MYLAGFLPGLLIARGADGDCARVREDLPLTRSIRRNDEEFFYSAWISIPALLTAFIIVGGVLLAGSRRRNPRVLRCCTQ